jgi:hypothetical protein
MGLELGVMQTEVYTVNVSNGWFEDERIWNETCALLLSEVYEIFEAYRDHGLKPAGTIKVTYEKLQAVSNPEVLYALAKCGYEQDATFDSSRMSPLQSEEKMLLAAEGFYKPEGVGSELADVLIRWLDTVERLALRAENFPCDPMLFRGLDFSGIIMEMTNSVAQLWKSANPGTMPDKYEMRMVLAHILGAADHWGVDLQWEYDLKIAYNKTRGHRHGGKKL